MPLDAGSYNALFIGGGGTTPTTMTIGSTSAEPDSVDHLLTTLVFSQIPGFDANQTATFDSGTAGSSRALVLYVMYQNGGDPGISAIQYGGQSLAKQLEVTVNPTDLSSETLEIWTLMDPPTGSNTLAFTNSATSGEDAAAVASVYVNVNQSDPVYETYTDPRIDSDNGVFDIGVVYRGGVAWGIAKDRGTDSTWTAADQNTVRLQHTTDTTPGAGSNIAVGDRLTGNSGTETCGATHSSPNSYDNAQDIAVAGISLRPAVNTSKTGTGGLTAQLATIGASVLVQTTVTASGTLSAQRAAVAGDNFAKSASAALGAGRAILSATGIRIITGAVSIVAQPVVVDGAGDTGSVTITAAGALVAGSGAADAEVEVIPRPTGLTASGALQASDAGVDAETFRSLNASGILHAERVRLHTVPWVGQGPVGTAWLDFEGGHWMVKIYKQ